MQVFSVLALSAMAMASATGGVSRRAEPAPLLRPSAKELVLDQYIVKTKSGSDHSKVFESAKAHRVFKSDGFKGFAAKLTAEELKAVRENPEVEYVEHDWRAELHDTQTGADWGISRISSQTPGATDYSYDGSAGEGTCVYHIDTGIMVDHPDFGGRAVWLNNFIDDDDTDGQGHGTWSSGLIASNTYGVAKKTTIYALKVFDSTGATDGSAIIEAMDFVAQDAPTRDCPAGHIANMSLGGGYSQSSNDAADNMVNAGVFVAVSAGNDNVDAAETSPASAPLVCTVAASDENDSKADFSSYGEVVDIWAPGTNLLSTSFDGTTTSASGTSGSAPIVAGIGAYLMALEGNTDGSTICDRVKELSLQGVLSNVPDGTTNALAYNGYAGNSTMRH